jgi:hypothetical protein
VLIELVWVLAARVKLLDVVDSLIYDVNLAGDELSFPRANGWLMGR